MVGSQSATKPRRQPIAFHPAGHRPLTTGHSFDRLVVIGSSTGGPRALGTLIPALPADGRTAYLIVQHMPPGFTRSLADRLDSASQLSVREAAQGDQLAAGLALIAPGNYHMTLVRSGARYLVRLNQDPPVNRHRPSVDVMFASVAKHAGGNSIGIILTGMGDDGAAGLLQMKQSGAYTIAQNESTCVVFGMPKEAIQAGAVDVVLPLGDIPNALLRQLREGGRRAM